MSCYETATEAPPLKRHRSEISIPIQQPPSTEPGLPAGNSQETPLGDMVSPRDITTMSPENISSDDNSVVEFQNLVPLKDGELTIADVYSKGRSGYLSWTFSQGGNLPPFAVKEDETTGVARDFFLNCNEATRTDAEKLSRCLQQSFRSTLLPKLVHDGMDPQQLVFRPLVSESTKLRTDGTPYPGIMKCRIDPASSKFTDKESGQPVEHVDVKQYDWSELKVVVRRMWFDQNHQIGFTLQLEEVLLVTKKEKDNEGTTQDANRLAVGELKMDLLTFLNPPPKTDGMKVSVPIRVLETGGYPVLHFTGGGIFPPFAVDYGGEQGASWNSQNSGPKLTFGVSDSAELAQLADFEQDLKKEICRNADKWVMGWKPGMVDAVVESKVSALFKPQKHGPGAFFSAKVSDESKVACVDTEGNSVPLAALPGMRYKEIRVVLLSLFSNHRQIGVVKRINRIVVLPR